MAYHGCEEKIKRHHVGQHCSDYAEKHQKLIMGVGGLVKKAENSITEIILKLSIYVAMTTKCPQPKKMI
jgi:hypothetical protein